MSAEQKRWGELIDTLGTTDSADVPPGPDACAEALGAMFLFLDSELGDEAASHRIGEHLGICVDCVAAYDREQLVRAVVARSCRGEQAPAGLRVRIEAFITAAVGPASATTGSVGGSTGPVAGIADRRDAPAGS